MSEGLTFQLHTQSKVAPVDKSDTALAAIVVGDNTGPYINEIIYLFIPSSREFDDFFFDDMMMGIFHLVLVHGSHGPILRFANGEYLYNEEFTR